MRALRTLIVAATVPVVLWAPPAQTDVEPVGPEIPVNTFLSGDQQVPAVSTDASGGFVVVWQSGNAYSYGATQDGSRAGVFGRRFDTIGTPLGGEIPINALTLGPQTRPSVATSAGGSFVAAFEGGGYGFDQDGSVSGVFLRRVAGGTPLGSDVQVNTFTAGPQNVPRVATDPTGNFVVVWQSGVRYGSGANPDGDGTGVFAQRYAAGGVPVGGEFQVNTSTAGNQSTPAIAVNPDRSFVIVWEDDGSGPGSTIRAQRFDALGLPVGAEFPVSTSPSEFPSSPGIAAASSGFVIVWQSYGDGSSSGIVGRRFDGAGTPLGGEFQVNTFTTGYQVTPAVAADGAGNFVVVWTSYGPSTPSRDGNAVFGQHFTATGQPLGGEFQVNTTTAGPQMSPAVSATSDGDFVVAWTSGYGYGASNGRDVFAQRLRTTAFTAPSPVAATRFVLRENTANPRRRRLGLRADDPAIGLGLGEGSRDDPALSGGRLRVRSAHFDDTYDLPASGWQRIGPPGGGQGWEYRDHALLSGPIERVEVRPGRILVSGKGAQLDAVLALDPDPVTAVLQLGSTGERECASLGGTTAFRPQKYFRARNAPPPADCRLP
jgi:hypothetical protein